MKGWTMNGPDGPRIESAMQMLGLFLGELSGRVGGWEQQLLQDPAQLGEVEREVHQCFVRGSGMVVVGLLAVASASQRLEQSSEEARRSFGYGLSQGRERTVRISFLGGLVFWFTSLYCAAASGGRGQAGSKRPGVHIEQAQFGIVKGDTPEVESRVSRQAALSPSLELAQEELGRTGLSMSCKRVRRISAQCGNDLLRLRAWRLEQWRTGTLAVGNELKGKRVTVQIDGGRTRIRSKLRGPEAVLEELNADGRVCGDALGRSRRRAVRTFDGAWREPKLVTIYVHDDDGRMTKGSQATIDGTLEGPNAMADLVAMHLHRLGGATAASITFASDGAPWIWNRVKWICDAAKIGSEVKIHEVLDCCHAVHHLSAALREYGASDEARKPLYRDYRTRVRNGQWREVVDELQELRDQSIRPTGAMQREIDYLRRNGQAGRMAYPHFRGLGIPLGSGGIESTIRRVVNQRLKGSGMFWLAEGAESMLQLRAMVVSKRWDEAISARNRMNCQTRLVSWHWTPSCNAEDETETESPNKPQFPAISP